MRSAGDQALRAEAADRMARGIEPRIRCELRLGSAVTVRRIYFRQMNSHRGYIGRAEFHVAKIVIDSHGVTRDVSVPKITCDSDDRKKLRLIPRSDRSQSLLEPVQIDLRVWRDALASSVSDDEGALRRVCGRQADLRDGILKGDRNARPRAHERSERKRNRGRQEVVLPQIREDRCNRA